MKLQLTTSIPLIFCALAVGVVALGGCGQRGPLRLPALPPEAVAPAAQAEPVPVSPPAVVETAPK